jgi:hypothetical protein
MPKRQRKSAKNPDLEERNPAAVALGRLGGLKRGQTVYESIPAAKRSMYASHAARARWAAYRAQQETGQNRADED